MVRQETCRKMSSFVLYVGTVLKIAKNYVII